METKIPEIEAREILLNYNGFNNQLLEWKKKFLEVQNLFVLFFVEKKIKYL